MRLPIIVVLTLFMPGCDLSSESRIDPETANEITFAEYIAPIIHENCTPCHRPGQVGPLGSGFGGPNGGGLLPDFDWTEDEKEEIREALEDTDAWTRCLDQTEEDGRWGADGTSAK